MLNTTRHIIKFTLALLLMCGSVGYAQVWPPVGMQGGGSASNPWQIKTAEDLHALALFVNASQTNANSTEGKHYRIMNHIDLAEFLGTPTANPQGWLPIGKGLDVLGNGRYAFKGYMHGGGHVISGLRINRTHATENRTENFFVGLFGVIENATIDSLGVEVAIGDSVKGDNFTGILVGSSYWNSTIEQVYTKGKISGQLFVGGLAGHLAGSRVENSYSTANVFGTSEYTGGLIGQLYFGGSVKYAYATGNVEGYSATGGLIGYLRFQSPTVENIFVANANVKGIDKIGKITGENFGSTPILSNGYASSSLVKTGNAGFNDGVERNSEDLKSESFFKTASNWTGGAWNFANIWIMEPDGYPVFQWQNLVEIPIIETFIVTSNAGLGGTISPMGDSTVVAGESITFVITANSGYKVDRVWINEIIREGITTTYTFENVRGDSSIYVTFDTIIIPPVVDPALDTILIAGGAIITPAFNPNVYSYTIEMPCSRRTTLFFLAKSGDTVWIDDENYTHKLYEFEGMEGAIDLLEVIVSNSTVEKTYTFNIRTPYDSVRIIKPFPNVLSVVNNPALFGGGQPFKDNGSYQWYKDGILLAGEKNGVLYLGAGHTIGNNRYSVDVTHIDGTTSRICPTSWEVVVNSLEVYPNPTVGHLSVRAAETFEKQPTRIEIFSLDGKLVEVFNSTGDITDLNLTHLPGGMYLVRQNGQTAIVVKH